MVADRGCVPKTSSWDQREGRRVGECSRDEVFCVLHFADNVVNGLGALELSVRASPHAAQAADDVFQ